MRISRLAHYDRNFYDIVLVRLWEMHKDFWCLRLSQSAVLEFYQFILLESNSEVNPHHQFFAPQLRIELCQRIKTLHILWFVRGLHWFILQRLCRTTPMDILLTCTPSSFYGKIIRLIIR